MDDLSKKLEDENSIDTLEVPYNDLMLDISDDDIDIIQKRIEAVLDPLTNEETIKKESVKQIIKEAIKEELEVIKNEKIIQGKKDFIIFDKVRKEYKNDSVLTVALDDVSFSIKEGELVIFLGHSGAGKTTALNMLGGMDVVTSGRIIIDDKEITDYKLDELTEYRRKSVGFIFQFYNLIQTLTAKENIDISTEIKEDYIDSKIVLEKVGLKDAINKFPQQLSGGEQQRVAIARAIAKKPRILLCDEPTGALDYKTGKQILKLIQETNKESNVTTIIITHNQAITKMADKVIHFNSGKVVDIEINENPVDVEDLEW